MTVKPGKVGVACLDSIPNKHPLSAGQSERASEDATCCRYIYYACIAETAPWLVTVRSLSA